MQAKVDGKEIDPSLIYFREMNYGQGGFRGTEMPYELSVPLSYFSEAMKKLYEDYAEDDLIYLKEDEPPILLELRSLGWPSLNILGVYYKDLLALFVREHLNYLALMGIFAKESESPRQPLYYINSIDNVMVSEDSIILKGLAIG